MEDFDTLLDQLPDSVRDVMEELQEAGRCSPAMVRLFTKLHSAPEHVVLALMGYLPNRDGDYVHAHVTKAKLHIKDTAHFAAWKLHLMALEPRAEVVRDDLH